MPKLVYCHHRVADYQKWLPFFDGDEKRHLSYGIQSIYVLSQEGEPNIIHLLFSIESIDQLKECLAYPGMGPILQEAGVLEKSDFIILNEK